METAFASPVENRPHPHPTPLAKGDGTLRVIGVLKLGKALLLAAIGIGLLGVMNDGESSRLQHWAWQLRPAFVTKLTSQAIDHLVSLPKSEKIALDIGTFIYGALFAVEGIGLLMRKHWAEWMTVVTTGLLIPFELYEIYERPTAWVRIATFIINIAILVYLIWRIRSDRRAREPQMNTNEHR